MPFGSKAVPHVRIGAITVSIVLHSALIAAAFTLPAPPKRTTPVTVDVDLFQRKAPKVETPPEPQKPEPQKVAEPEKPPAKPEKPEKKDPELAMREPEHPQVAPQPLTPEPATPQPTEPNPDKKPPGKVDLTLHALPGGDGVIVHDGPGTFGTTYGGGTTPGGKKPWKVDAGNPLIGKLDDVKEERFPLTPVADGGYQYKGKAFTARISRDGRVSFDNKSIRDFNGLSGGFDVTDMLMRAKHNDPYRVEKQAFMDHTETLRKKLMADAQKEHMAASLAQIPSHLDEIWRSPTRPPEARRKLIYDFWIDAAEADSDAGREACGIIETYVRRYLPDGTPTAYSDDELAKLNQGKKYKFAPYR